ncbi:hypothetical protein [Bradyrhizobium sp. STM 3562]|uniref:hypothetical protein n=1 Tax=Bradyrhizobium sp. STM 3562 TaxID=578924 RepID=UPI00388FC8C2
MLPGFRFLFAAIVVSTSVLVFGLGAAAIMRAAHEEFASSGSWRPAPEASVAQQAETAKPVIAMLRIEPTGAESKEADVSLVAAPTPAAANPSPQAAPEKTAALDPQASTPNPVQAEAAQSSDAVKQETVTPEVTAKPAMAEASAPAAASIAVPQAVPGQPVQETVPTQAAAPSPSETKTASIEQATTAASAASPDIATAAPAAVTPASSTASEPPLQDTLTPADASATGRPDPTAGNVATLGGAPVAIDQPATETKLKAEPDRSDAKKDAEAKKEKERARRRRLAARRARLAREAAMAQQRQQALYPFGQPSQPMPFAQPAQPTQFAQPAAATR